MVTGVSGYVFGGIVSHICHIPLIVVRKTEKCHSSFAVEYSDELKKKDKQNIAFFDDLISSGATLEKVAGKLAKEEMTIKCAILYNDGISHYDKRGFDIPCYSTK